MRPARHQVAAKHQHTEECRLEKEGHQVLVRKQGEITLAAASEKRAQLVPNWNGMMMPVTTPMPKATEKIRIQNARCAARRRAGRNTAPPKRR